MRRIHLENVVVELSEPDFLALVTQSAESFWEIAAALVGHHLLGFPDILGATRGLLEEGLIRSEKSLEPELHDGELNQELNALHTHVHKLVEMDKQMVERLAKWVGLPFTNIESDRRRLYSRLIRQKETLHGALPKWVTKPEYQSFLEESKQALSRIAQSRQTIRQRIQQLLERSVGTQSSLLSKRSPPVLVDPSRLTNLGGHPQPKSEEGGDQRAKDLIDESWEYEPVQAISVLRKALRYGRTGIQASAAYQALGMRYEDLGDERKAIAYYTKSIKAWPSERPPAIVLFWRGQAYYRQKQLVKAQADLEKALKIGLSSPEREQAQDTLGEIMRRTSVK